MMQYEKKIRKTRKSYPFAVTRLRPILSVLIHYSVSNFILTNCKSIKLC